MSSDDRVEALKAKHAALDVALGEENRRPHPDTTAIADIKRQKLRIKDEIQRIDHH